VLSGHVRSDGMQLHLFTLYRANEAIVLATESMKLYFCPELALKQARATAPEVGVLGKFSTYTLPKKAVTQFNLTFHPFTATHNKRARVRKWYYSAHLEGMEIRDVILLGAFARSGCLRPK